MEYSSNSFSDRVLDFLKLKTQAHNSKYQKKVTVSQLQKVYRRGAESFAAHGKPGKTRGQWAVARVNMFLKMLSGARVKDDYRKADQDISEAGIIIDDGIRNENFLTEEDLIAA
jgi:hypothetical protein